MKKSITQIVKKMLATLAVMVIMLPGLTPLTFAQPTSAPPPANDPTAPTSDSNAPTTVKDGAVTVDELLYQFNYKGTTEEQMAGTKIGAVNALPKSPWTKTLAEVIKMLLNITGGLALLAFTVGGTMMVLSSGNGDLLEKGKKVTIAAIAGLVIIAVSYALVIGVSELQFLSGSGAGSEAEQTPAAASQPSNGASTGAPDATSS